MVSSNLQDQIAKINQGAWLQKENSEENFLNKSSQNTAVY